MDYASRFDQLVKVEPIDSNELEKLMLKLIEDTNRREHAKVNLWKVELSLSIYSINIRQLFFNGALGS